MGLVFICVNLPYDFAWYTVVMTELVLPDKLQNKDKPHKQVRRTVGPLLAACYEPLGYC